MKKPHELSHCEPTNGGRSPGAIVARTKRDSINRPFPRKGRSNLIIAKLLRTLRILAMTFLICNIVFAADKIRVVTTTSTLAAMARTLLGNIPADIYFVASPTQNIHFIQPTPKDVLKVKKAEVLIHQGLDLEAWREPLLIAAGNPLFLGQRKNAIDVSEGISLLEIPTSLSRIEGDIHLYGNPHYTVDPENAKIMMTNIANGFSRLFPESANDFGQRKEAWISKLDQKINDWTARMSSFKNAPIVTYHRSWSYFAKRFHLDIVGELEPKPGIPPTPRHLSNLMILIKEKNVRAVIKETFNDSSPAEKIAKANGAKVVTLFQYVGESKENVDYISMTEHNIQEIEGALKR